MSEIALPEDILQIIWKKFYSIYVVPGIVKQALLINKNKQILCDYVYLDPYERQHFFMHHFDT